MVLSIWAPVGSGKQRVLQEARIMKRLMKSRVTLGVCICFAMMSAGPAMALDIVGDRVNSDLEVTGDVGIGTASPDAMLHIKKTTSSYAPSELHFEADGINTAAQVRLQRLGTNRETKFILQTGSVADWHVGVVRKGGGLTEDFSISQSADLFVTPPEFILMKASGNVGIGTSFPSSKLEVKDVNDVNISSRTNTDVGGAGILLQNPTRLWRIYNDGANSSVFRIRDITAGQTRLTIDASGDVTIGGEASVKVLEITGGADLAEMFPVSDAAPAGRTEMQDLLLGHGATK
jgi:hypothetical protein